MTFTYPAKVIAKKAADRKIAKERIKELEAVLQRFIDDAFKNYAFSRKGERHCYWCGKRTWDGEPPQHNDDCPVVIARQVLEGSDIPDYIDRDFMSQDDVERVITQYERQFGMSSEEFLQKHQEGTVPDTYEAMDWVILLKHYRLGDGSD